VALLKLANLVPLQCRDMSCRALFGGDYHWSILATGRHQMGLCTVGAVMGANVRVGLEGRRIGGAYGRDLRRLKKIEMSERGYWDEEVATQPPPHWRD
jgi:hypothetical protein